MVDYTLDFLSQETVEIPTGVGTPFQPSGLISKWSAGIAFRVGYTMIDLALDGEKADQTIKSNDGTQFLYYFLDGNKARDIATRYGVTIKPEQVWLFQTMREMLLNVFEEGVINNFKPLLTYEVAIKTYRSKKYRHELHLIALPAAVQAAALRLGLLTEPVFNLSELVLPSREGEPDKFTDQFQFDMIGDPDAPGANTPEGLLDTELGKRRAALWAALDEPNGLAYIPKGSTDDAKLVKFVTTSGKLSACLNILHKTWAKPAWAEMVSVFDPRVDAVMGNDTARRLRIPVLHRLFASEAEARAEAQRQHEERVARAEGKAEAVAGSNGAPAIPAEWTEMPDDFRKEFQRVVAQGNPNPKIAKDMSITVGEVVQWKDYLKI